MRIPIATYNPEKRRTKKPFSANSKLTGHTINTLTYDENNSAPDRAGSPIYQLLSDAIIGFCDENEPQEDPFTQKLKQIREQQKAKSIQSAQATRSRDIKAGIQVKEDVFLDPPKRDYLKDLIRVELETKEIVPVSDTDPRYLIRKRAMQEFKEVIHGECRQLQQKKVILHTPTLRSQTPPEKKPVPSIQPNVPLAVESPVKKVKEENYVRQAKERSVAQSKPRGTSPERPQKLTFRVLSQLKKQHENNAANLFKFIEQHGQDGDYEAVDFAKLAELYGDEVNNYIVTTFDQLE